MHDSSKALRKHPGVMRDAERLLHYLDRNQRVMLFDLIPPLHTEACWYETISQILNFFDQETVRDVAGHFKLSVQQILSSPEWEGHYVDAASMRGILNHLSLDHHLPESAIACDIKQEVVSLGEREASTTVATQEMIANILCHRDDASVRWEGKTMTAETAINICEGHGLWIARDAFRRFSSYEHSHEPWTSIFTDADIIGLFDSSNDSDFIASATSRNSFQSNHNRVDRFNPSKKKALANIPLLPQQKLRPLEEENTPVRKVEEWIIYEPQRRSQTESTLSPLIDNYDGTSSICDE